MKRKLRSKAVLRSDGFSGQLEELEGRLLYNADFLTILPQAAVAATVPPAQVEVMPALSDAGRQGREVTPVDAAASEATVARTSLELVFVDAGVPDADQLLALLQSQTSANRSLEVHWIDGRSDGLSQITEVLKGREGIDAIHVISHGDGSGLQLGNSRLDSASLSSHLGDLATWGAALSPDADLMLYGCDLASSSAGRALVDDLALLTGADVAASSDATGSALLGGNWTLEYQEGRIETSVAMSASGQMAWQHVLGVTASSTAETLVNGTTTGTQENNIDSGKQVAADANGNYVVVWEDATTLNVYGRLYNADGTAATAEFRVNTNTATTKDQPTLAMDANGNFVVAWRSVTQDGSGYGIYAQRYNASGVAQGGEFRVNTYTNSDQFYPAIAMNTSGFVITWTSYGQDGDNYGVYAQRYNASGVAQGSEFKVNTTTANIQKNSQIGMDDSGNFVIAWSSYAQDGAGYGVYAQRYNASGVAQGSEFRANVTTTGEQILSDVSMNASGNFVIAWHDSAADGSDYGVFARTYNSSGVAQTSEFVLSKFTYSIQRNASVVMGDDGSFVAAWESLTADGYAYGIAIRQFSLDGTEIAPEIIVNTTRSGEQQMPSVAWGGNQVIVTWSGNGSGDNLGIFARRYTTALPAAVTSVGTETRVNTTTSNTQQTNKDAGKQVATAANGNHVIVWEDTITDYVYGRLYDANGNALTAEFRVNTDTTGARNKDQPTVAMDDNGNFVIAWHSQLQDGAGYGIYAQRYNASGVAQGSEFRVNTYTTSDQEFPAIAMSAVGFVITWTSYGQDGAVEGIYAQRYNASGVAQGSEFRVNSYTTNIQTGSKIGMDDNGNFVIAWSSYGQDGAGYGAYAQRYNASGVAQGAEFRVNVTTAGEQIVTDVSMNGSGSFVISWDASASDGAGYGTFARTYDSNGTALSGEVQINSFYLDEQRYSSVSMSDTGDFVAVFQSGLQDGYANAIALRVFSQSGVEIGGERLVNSTQSGSQSSPSVSWNGAYIAVAWSGNGTGDNLGVFSQRFVSNAAPEITSNAGGSSASVNVFESSTAVTTVTATDSNGDVLTYSISGGADAAKFTINASTGVLTFITAPNFDSPGDAGGNNVYDVIVRVSDGALSDTQALAITVLNVNDAPIGTSKTVSTLEDTAYTFTASDFGFTDPNDSSANALLNVKITTLPGTGSLTLNGVAVTAGQFVSAANIAAGLLKFTPATHANGTGYASFTFQVQDNGGTANGGVDLDATPRTMTVNVTSVNDAPVGASKTVTTNEDTAYTFTTADFGFFDPNDSPANTLAGVKITTLPATGSLTLNGVAVTTGQVISAANIASNLLKFTPATNANGTGNASFTFQVQDNGGTANGGVDLDATPRTMTVDVTAVNDAPVGASTTITTLEDTAYNFTAADFGFSDPNDSPANTLSGVKITTLPASGSLTLNGVAVTAGQVISAANIASNLLKFTPAANANGTGYTSFTFQVQDNGGTANGGVDLDVTPRTMTVNVTAVNDAPAGTDKTVTTLEDTAYTFTAADFGFTDPNDSPANTLLGVKITTLPGSGSLTLNGVAVTAGQVVSAANIASNLLKFTPAANANGTGYASFTFQVQDNGGTANGGVDLDATPRTITVDVTAVNDAPVGSNKTVTTLEDTVYTFTAADFGFTDPNDSPANTLLGVKITTLPGSGSLTLNGVAVTAGQVISAANIASNLLKFTPAAHVSGTGYASFTFQVQDNGGTANGGADLDVTPRTMTVNVTAVNDAPVGASTTITTLEDTAYTFTAADFGFSDTNDSPANTLSGVKITTLPASGSLTLNGVAVTAGQVISAANIASNLLKFTPAANANGTGYTSFTFQVQDNGGTANGGVDLDVTPRTMTVNVTAVNDAPAGTDKTVTTLEDTAYTFTAADFGFTDPNDSPANTLLGVKITTLPGSGSLTLNGVAVMAGQVVSAANIASNLLKFTPAANANGTGYASFTFQVQDNGGTANGGVDLDATPNTLTINVTAVNDAPAGTDKTVTTLEDTAYTFTAADFGFTDPNDSPVNTLSGVKITTLPGSGSLTLNGVAVTAGQVISAANIASNLLKFTPASDANGAGNASFTFQVQDNGGTANGGVDLDGTPNTITINVTAVNDAPVGTNHTVTTLEDTAYTFTAADFGFTDPNDSPANTLSGVKITTLPGSGTLTLNGVAVTAGQVVSAANIASNLLKFTPAANANGTGYASFTFQVQDNGGTANGGVDLDATPNTMTVNVTAVNDAPVGTSKTVTTLEDTAYTFTAADFGFTDPNDSPANTLLAVKITTLPGSGTLTLNGVAVTAGQVVSAANIASNLLKFTPAANANGAGYASFTFQVQDNGGTANGGVDLDATPRTMTVDVSSVNDAPVGTSNTVTTLEDTAYTFTAADFGFSDPNDSPANTLSGVKITTLPATGSLTLNGVAVTAGQVISAANIASNLLKFTPAANANGTGNASFTFQVQDNGGTANGGVDMDTTARTMTVNVTAVNDAPAGTDKTVTTLEDTAYTFTAADFGFTDPNDSPANTFSGVRISSLPLTGSLTLNGVAVTVNQVISAANIASNLLKFTPAANANGAGSASFTFQVQDNGGTANGGVDQDTTPRTMTVSVTAVNDAPVGTSKTVTTLEDTAYTFTVADFGFTDPNDSPANTLLAVKITTVPASGSVTLNGVAVTTGQPISAADIASGLLKFTPAPNAAGAGNASFTFQVQDNGGTANGGVDLDTTPRTMTVDVTAVNDAPSGANRTVTTPENTDFVFSAADFGFTDTSDAQGHTLLAVKITTLPGAGTLMLNGVAINAGDFVQVSDIVAGLLVFTPLPGASGQPYASFTFQVQDNGGTANGGVDLDASANTMTLNVTSKINSAPEGLSKTVTTVEDVAYVFTTADFGFSDPGDTPSDQLLAVRITTVPGAGTLMLNGVLVNAGDFVLASDIAAGLLRFTPAADANGAGHASFTFQVQDDGGTAGGGMDVDATPRTMTVDVTAVNDAPVGTSNTVTTPEDTAYAFTVADFGFTDPHDASANALAGVKLTTVPGSGSLLLNGLAVTAGQVVSAADILAGKLVYAPAADGQGTGYASFTFQVQDDGGTANGGADLDGTPRTMTVNVTAVNDAPVGTDNTVSTLEDTAHVFDASDFGFTDPKDAPDNALLGVRITTLPGSGTLTLNGVAVTAGQVVSAIDIAAGLLVYTPGADDNGAGYTSFTFQVQDDGGTANGGVSLDATPRTMAIDVTPVNDAPVGTDNTVTTLEDTTYTFTVADFGFTDPEDVPGHALLAVRITTLPVKGSLTLNGVAISAGDSVSAADIAAGLLRYTPAPDDHGAGYTSFTFQVRDNGGTANGGVSVDATPRTLTVDVTSVNDAPVGTDKTVTTLEDTGYAFTAADFGLADPADSPGNTLFAVKIVTLPGSGTLTLNGLAVSAGDFISALDIAAGLLVYTPGANDHGAGYTSFTFQVQDNGGTANGGVNLDGTPRTMAIDVTSVNDAPVGTGHTVSTLEDTAYTFTATDFGFTDPDDAPGNALQAVLITTVPGSGSLTLSGVAVTAGQLISLANLNAGLLKYTPGPDDHGTGYASFAFQVRDNGGTANGGVDLDTTPRTMTIDVSSVNDAPVGTSKTVTTLEDTAYIFTVADFGFTDPNDAGANTLLAVRISTLPGAGSLTLNGAAVSLGDVVSAFDIASGLLVYIPGADAHGAGYTSFTFQVQDNGGTANGGVNLDTTARTMTVNVTSVNDAPSGASTTITTLEDTAYTFMAADFGFADPKDAPGNALLAVRISTLPASGTLTLNGVAVSAGDFISGLDIAAGLLVYTPGADDHGAGYTSFTFQVQDNGGTANGGVNLDGTPRTMAIDVTSVNDAPVGTDHTVTTLEDTVYAFTAADFGFTDPSDSPGNALQAVRITTLPTSGSLMLNGVAVTAGQLISLANIDSGLLKFTPAPDANGAGYASFTFQVRDNGGTANGGADLDGTPRTLTIDVSSVNDAPVGADKTVSTHEDTGYTFTVADFGFTDPKDAPGNTLQGVMITTLPGSGSLRLNGMAVAAGQVISAFDIAAGLLIYTPGTDDHGTGHASFTFQVQDNGGAASGGVNLDTTPRTMTIDVTSVNDAPTGASTTITTLEDTAYTFHASDFGFADPDDTPGNALAGVMVTTLPGSGTLLLNGVAVTAGQIISAADLAAGLLVYTPGANDHGAGYTSFTFQVQDNGGTANGGVDLDATPRTMTIDVTSVNDAPVGTGRTVTTLEDMAYTFTAADFGFTDPDDAPGNTLLAVGITILPSSGTLTLNGVAVAAGQVISLANITSGLLKFTPVADANGAGYTSFTFQVQDNGGTANGGVDLDGTPRTMTIDVTSVNDAPVGTSKTVVTNEDTGYTFTVADFGFTDPKDAPGNTLQGVMITALPGAGSLLLNGVAVTAGQVISAADIAAGLLVYAPGADGQGAGYASFTFQVQDQGGTAHGGVNLDTLARTMTVNVGSVNDAPAGTSKTVTTNEDIAYTFTVSDFGFTDAQDSPANAFQGVRITTLPTNGSLRLNGVAIVAGQTISAADIAAGLLVYTPDADDHGAGYASFTFQVQDDGGTANGGANLDTTPRAMTVNVGSVNDAPVGTSTSVTLDEDRDYTFTAADFGFADLNDSPANTFQGVRITTLPNAGSLTLSGVAVTAGQVISAADIGAGLLVYTPGADANGTGYAGFTFQVQDDGGTANGGANQDVTPRTLTFNVTPVNDAPTGVDKTVTIQESTSYTFTVADFGFHDGRDSPANSLLAVRIATLPGLGTLRLNGLAVSAGDLVLASDIAAGKLVFTPIAGASGAPHASFTFQVQDDGGTALAGQDTDTIARSLSIAVTAAPSAPVVSNPGTGGGLGATPPPVSPATPTQPTTPSTDPKDEGSDEVDDKLEDDKPLGSSNPENAAPLPPVQSDAKDTAGRQNTSSGRASSGAYDPSSSQRGNQAGGFVFRLEAGGLMNLGVTTGNILLEMAGMNAAKEASSQNLHLSFSTTAHGSGDSAPSLVFADSAEDHQVRIEKAAIQTSGAALSIGAVWWAARMSGLLASLMISTPGWRSIDPLPVMGLGQGGGPDEEDGDDDEHGDHADAMDARAARLFGARQAGNRELEGIG